MCDNDPEKSLQNESRSLVEDEQHNAGILRVQVVLSAVRFSSTQMRTKRIPIAANERSSSHFPGLNRNRCSKPPPARKCYWNKHLRLGGWNGRRSKSGKNRRQGKDMCLPESRFMWRQTWQIKNKTMWRKMTKEFPDVSHDLPRDVFDRRLARHATLLLSERRRRRRGGADPLVLFRYGSAAPSTC